MNELIIGMIFCGGIAVIGVVTSIVEEIAKKIKKSIDRNAVPCYNKYRNTKGSVTHENNKRNYRGYRRTDNNHYHAGYMYNWYDRKH